MSISDSRPLLSVLVSHPIQYHAPLYRRLARSEVLRLRVEYLSTHGMQASFDPGFGRKIRFDVDLVGGFEHRWHTSRFSRGDLGHFTGLVHPALLTTLHDADVVLLHGYAHASMWFAAVGRLAQRRPYMLRGESNLLEHSSLRPKRRLLKRGIVSPLVSAAAVCLPIG